MKYASMLPTVAGVVAGALAGSAVVLISALGTSGDGKPDTGAEAARRRNGGPERKSETADLRRQIAGLRGVQHPASDAIERIESLERRLDELAQQEPPVPPNPIPPSPEEAGRDFASRVATLERDAVDPDWAPNTSTLLTRSLAEFATQAGYEAVDVDCRTTSCMATLRWDSLEAAEAGMEKAVRAQLRANCSRGIRLNDAAEPDGSFHGTMLLDCTEWRASGSVPLFDELPEYLVSDAAR